MRWDDIKKERAAELAAKWGFLCLGRRQWLSTGRVVGKERVIR